MHGVRFGQTQVWRILGSLGFSAQKPEMRAIERDEEAVRKWKRRTWPALKKAQREGRLIVFIGESGISERPTRVRTWGLRGQTPVIQFHFNWNHVSVIAGLTRTNCLFRLHEGSIKKEQIVEFLKALKAHLKQPLLIIWDGLKAHRSRLVRDYLDSLDGHIQMAFLPPYSPDLNPVEYLWAQAPSAMPWPTTVPTTSPSCTPPRATSSRAPRSDPRSSPRAGLRLRFGDVMIYGGLNSCSSRQHRGPHRAA